MPLVAVTGHDEPLVVAPLVAAAPPAEVVPAWPAAAVFEPAVPLPLPPPPPASGPFDSAPGDAPPPPPAMIKGVEVSAPTNTPA